jgi:exosortase F-associated protein
MLKKIWNHKIRVGSALIFVVFLALIRAYEDQLFYDPFLTYFKLNYYNLPLPEVDFLSLYANLTLRFVLNSLISLAIIFILFKDKDAIQFASFLYLLFYIILIIAFFGLLYYKGETDKMALFYIRRFLIQPLFLLLFLPAFYFQQQKSN